MQSPVSMMAAILYRYAQLKGYDVSTKAYLSGYTDAASVGAYAIDAMAWANGAELITGTSTTTLSPAGNATRAQVATILMRFCETSQSESFPFKRAGFRVGSFCREV